MVNQTTLRKETGISHGKLMKLQAEGKFLPQWKPVVGKDMLFSDEQLEELRAYKDSFDNTGLTTLEFAIEVGESYGIILDRHKKGYLKEHHRDYRGRCRYTDDQVRMYLEGKYDPKREEGFYTRKDIAGKFGVSLGLVKNWIVKGLLVVDHKGRGGIEFFTVESVDKLYGNEGLWLTDTLKTKRRKRVR